MSDVSSSNWSETDASNDILGGPGWPGGMNANQVEPNARGMMGAIRRIWDRLNPQQSSAGSGGAYVWTPANISYPTAYMQGEIYWFKANFTSVGGDTLNVNGLGAKPIYKTTNAGLIAIAASDMELGSMYALAYDSALNSGGGGFQLLNSSGAIPSGTIMHTAASAAPAGWLLANGAAVSRTTYATLFAAIGTAYGSGDGSTTFNLPDGRGRVLVGQDPSNATGRLTANTSQGVSAATLGNAGGEQSHTLATGELAAHNHGVNDPSHIHGVGDPGHGHGVADPTHAHSVADPTHTHGVGDPGHAHTLDGNVWANYFDSAPDKFAEDPGGQVIGTQAKGGPAVGTFASGTGVYLGAAYTGIGIYGAATGIAIDGSGTGVFLGYAATGISIQNAGSGSTHNNVQPTLIVNHIIKI